MYKIITSADFNDVAIPDNTFIQAKIKVKGDKIEWLFRSRREMNKTLDLFMNANVSYVRRAFI